ILGVPAGAAEDAGILIRAPDQVVRREIAQIAGFLPRRSPHLGVEGIEKGPLLRDERPAEAWGDISGHQSGFDGNRAGTTKWIGKRPIPLPVSQLQNPSGE